MTCAGCINQLHVFNERVYQYCEPAVDAVRAAALSCIEYLGSTTGAHNFVKLTKHGSVLADAAGLLDITKGIPSAVRTAMGHADNVLNGILTLPQKSLTLLTATMQVVHLGPNKSEGILLDMLSLLPAIGDVWDALQTDLEMLWTSMSKNVATTLERIGGVTLQVGMGGLALYQMIHLTDLAKKIWALRNQVGREGEFRLLCAEAENRLLVLGLAVSYVALGTLIVAASFFAVAVAPAAMAAATASAALFSITGHFHEKHVWDPLNPQA